nr:hypothetical protein [Tanacetum cinerariifolium]
MIPDPGDTNRKVPVNETFHVQTDDELTKKELKQIEADDQAIQTILLGLLKDIYVAVDSCKTAQEIWNQVIQNAIQNPRIQNVRNQNGLTGVLGNANQNGNGNLVVARAEGNAIGHNDGSAEVHDYENCYDNEIFNMFTQEQQYTELLEPILESHQVPQNDNNVVSEVISVEQSRETVEQHYANVEETRALYDSLYQNLDIEAEKVNTINALHLSSGKQIMTLNEEISDLNKQLSKEKLTVSFLLEEKKKLKSDFKTREDKLLDKQIQLEKMIKELDNIVVKTGQSIQTIHMLS